MTLLDKLTFSDASPREKLSPVGRKRLKLLEQLDIQITAAQAELDGATICTACVNGYGSKAAPKSG